jgi:hypothetical protein
MIQTHMPRVGFELTIPIFERAKTIHDLDRAGTVIGKPISSNVYTIPKFEVDGKV